MPNKIRCPWANSDPLSREYHDQKWGVPCHDERELFKTLILEGQQAGLAWVTVLRKMDGYNKAFANFDPEVVAKFDQRKIDSLLSDPGIIRNRLKIASVVENARAYLRLREKGQSLDEFLWAYVDGQPLVNHWKSMAQIPAKTNLSEKISRDLKALGFKFVGPISVYAYVQSVGLINDHLIDCSFRRVK
jgi:DNA-3-methyladenine glycosylase I